MEPETPLFLLCLPGFTPFIPHNFPSGRKNRKMPPAFHPTGSNDPQTSLQTHHCPSSRPGSTKSPPPPPSALHSTAQHSDKFPPNKVRHHCRRSIKGYKYQLDLRSVAVLPGLPTWQHCPLAKAIPLPVTAGGNLGGLPSREWGWHSS